MVRASIPAGIACGRADVRRSHDPRVGCQGRVDVISVNREFSTWRVASHVLVDNGEHRLSGRLVTGEDGLGPQEAALLTRVEVELERVFGFKTCVREDPQRLEQNNHAGAVVISARSARRGGASCRIVVGRYNDCRRQRLAKQPTCFLVRIHAIAGWFGCVWARREGGNSTKVGAGARYFRND